MMKRKLKSKSHHYFESLAKRAGGALFSLALVMSTGMWVLGVMHLTSAKTSEIDSIFHRNEVLSAKESKKQQILNSPSGSKMFACPENSPIKGTLEAQGKKLYLEPHNPDYLYTKPDSCFSSIEQAVNEGYISNDKNQATSDTVNNDAQNDTLINSSQNGDVLGVNDINAPIEEIQTQNVVMESVGQNLEESSTTATKSNKTVEDLPKNLSFDQMLNRSNQTKIIVVNLADQTLKKLDKGKVESETKITSGRTNFDTPTGQFLIINKAKNIRLKAPSPRFGNYDLKVQYWLGFGNGYGFHDAYWRSSFGGDDYATNGSHGCINMPLEAVKSMYDWAGIGTEVYII